MRAIATLVLILFAVPSWADEITDRLMQAIQAPKLLSQLAIEAEASAGDLDEDFLAGQGGDLVANTARQLNAPDRVLPILAGEITRLMSRDDRLAVTSFFESDLGQRLVDLEIAARVAIFDDALLDTVKGRVLETGVRPLITEIIETSDLVERNVADGLSVLEQFYRGRQSGGMTDLTGAEIGSFLAELEDGIRIETQGWLDGFMTLAYSPIEDRDLQIYADFWKTEAGQAFDKALFGAFLKVMSDNSFAMGQLVGRIQASDEI